LREPATPELEQLILDRVRLTARLLDLTDRLPVPAR
jgi:hypothetical protein